VFIAQMKGRVTALVCGLGFAVATSGSAQGPVNKYGNPPTHPPKPTTAAITAEELRTRLYIFADDSMQGRRVATVGNMKGTAYIASELKRLGIEPGGDNGGYFQRLPYVLRKINGTPSLSVGGTSLTFLTDFVAVPGARAPKIVANVPVIFGGVVGDSTRMITAEQAAGKFVVMSVSATNPQGTGGRGTTANGINFTAGNTVPAPQGCPAPGAGRGGAGGGRGGNSAVAIAANIAAAAARFPNAIGVATIDLDALSPAQRMEIGVPLSATAVGGGRGGAADPEQLAAARVATPIAAYKGTSGDIVVTNGNGVAIIRNGAIVAGTLPAGMTVASVIEQRRADSVKSADSTRTVMERRDTLAATARRLIAEGKFRGTATFRGGQIPLDSGQIVTLGCAPANAGRGGGGGGGNRGGGGGNRGGGNRGGGGGAAASAEAPVAMFHLSSAAVNKIFGNRMDGLQPGATAGNATATVEFVEEPSDWARNVVGIVRGSDPKLAGEYVAIGGHNDHNGLTTPVDHDSLKAWNDANLRLQMQVVKGDLRAITPEQRASIRVNMDSIRKLHPVARMDSVNNGADDDGSGSMAVLEIAEAIAKMPVKPKRSIIFIWHTGEEAGLLGSNYWTANPTVPIDSVVAQINIDMIGRGRAEDMVGGGPNYVGAVGSQRLSKELNRQMLAVNAKEPAAKRLRIDYRFDDPTLGTSVDGKPASWPGYNNIYGRSDHANYAAKCVPIVFFFTGLHGDYHQRTDEPQYIDYPHYAMITDYIKDLMVDIGNRPVRPALDKACTRR
jgi:hypothetical protein